MDAVAVSDPENGPCDCMLGYSWNGSACEALTDCACQGEDCNKLSETKEDCEAAHETCTAGTTGTGSTDVTTLRLACGSEQLRAAVHGECDPMDAIAKEDPQEGPCDCFLGYSWNGSACVALADCFCEGADCNKLHRSQDDCQAVHANCN